MVFKQLIRFRLPFMALALAGSVLSAKAQYESLPESLEQVDFQQHINTFFADYCWDCHDDITQKAELNLAAYAGQSPTLYTERRLWETVRDMLEKREMPPSRKPQPSEEDRHQVVLFIEKELAKFDCSGPVSPGRVTIRRLNRAEYRNTIRDLIGISFDPTEDFPLDEVGYGFDNIGDVLSLPPMLVEKYLTASERIVSDAIVTDVSTLAPQTRYQGARFKLEAEREAIRVEGDGVLGFWRNSGASRQVDFPANGRYLLRVNAYGDQAGSEPPQLEVQLNDERIAVLNVGAQSNEPRDYDVEFVATAASGTLRLSYLNNSTRNGDRNVFVNHVDVIGPIDSASIKYPAPHRRIIPRQPTAEEEANAARQYLEQFASRAFRRPVLADEIDRLFAIYELGRSEGGSFNQGMQLAAQAVLVSPQFLFRWELDPLTNEGAPRQLNDYELASRLSYFIWSSPPDEELATLAAEGVLHQPEILKEQVERMIRDEKSWALVENFAGQWLQIRQFDVSPDPELFSDFDESLRRALRMETLLFFDAVMREDLSIMTLLDSDFTFANERLARHYGVEGVRGPDFQRITLDPAGGRGGILTQGSILALNSNPTRTSPVVRGKWILEQILGTPPPPPPPNVPELEEGEAVDHSASLRERLEQHRANPDCATCHAKMDPLGFALENFDATGAWRDKDGEHPIDPAGVLPDGRAFSGPRELKSLLMEGDQFVRTLSEKMLTFALGRGLEYYDKCTVDEMVDALERDEFRFSTMVLKIVESRPFQMRQTPEDES